jgi:hypothetical protein
MKRQILCPPCGASLHKHSGMKTPRAGADYGEVLQTLQDNMMKSLEEPESLREIPGKLRFPCWCDLCGEPLLEGREVLAVSYSSSSRPYHPWEEEYLIPSTPRIIEVVEVGEKGTSRQRKELSVKRWLQAKRPPEEDLERVTSYRTEACTGYNMAYEAGEDPDLLGILTEEYLWALGTMRRAGRIPPEDCGGGDES